VSKERSPAMPTASAEATSEDSASIGTTGINLKGQRVDSIVEGSSADVLGLIQVGDEIVEVDGVPVHEDEDVTQRLQGPVGTQVVIGLVKLVDARQTSVALVRHRQWRGTAFSDLPGAEVFDQPLAACDTAVLRALIGELLVQRAELQQAGEAWKLETDIAREETTVLRRQRDDLMRVQPSGSEGSVGSELRSHLLAAQTERYQLEAENVQLKAQLRRGLRAQAEVEVLRLKASWEGQKTRIENLLNRSRVELGAKIQECNAHTERIRKLEAKVELLEGGRPAQSNATVRLEGSEDMRARCLAEGRVEEQTITIHRLNVELRGLRTQLAEAEKAVTGAHIVDLQDRVAQLEESPGSGQAATAPSGWSECRRLLLQIQSRLDHPPVLETKEDKLAVPPLLDRSTLSDSPLVLKAEVKALRETLEDTERSLSEASVQAIEGQQYKAQIDKMVSELHGLRQKVAQLEQQLTDCNKELLKSEMEVQSLVKQRDHRHHRHLQELAELRQDRQDIADASTAERNEQLRKTEAFLAERKQLELEMAALQCELKRATDDKMAALQQLQEVLEHKNQELSQQRTAWCDELDHVQRQLAQAQDDQERLKLFANGQYQAALQDKDELSYASPRSATSSVQSADFQVPGVSSDRASHPIGVGIFIEQHESSGALCVRSILRGSAADRAGNVQTGDEVLSVNGVSLTGHTPASASARIVGPPGTQCRLFLRRGPSQWEVSLTRGAPEFLDAIQPGGLPSWPTPPGPPSLQHPPKTQAIDPSVVSLTPNKTPPFLTPANVSSASPASFPAGLSPVSVPPPSPVPSVGTRPVSSPPETPPRRPMPTRGFVGVYLGEGEAGCDIRGILQGSAAERAGVQVSDVLLAIDGQETEGHPPSALQSLLIGAPGSVCRLTIMRDGVASDIRLMRTVGGESFRSAPGGPPAPEGYAWV